MSFNSPSLLPRRTFRELTQVAERPAIPEPTTATRMAGEEEGKKDGKGGKGEWVEDRGEEAEELTGRRSIWHEGGDRAKRKEGREKQMA